MEVWSGSNRSCEPYLYFCGFMYYVGCFASPFLASPFLATRSKKVDDDASATNVTMVGDRSGPLLLDELEELEDLELIGTTKVQYAYLASGAIVSVVFVAFTCFYAIWGRAVLNSKNAVVKTDVKKDSNK